MDFRRNPSVIDQRGLDGLSEEAYTYLANSGALQKLPIERLLAMKPKAYDLYMDHDIDLSKEPLEIAVCAQHNNGDAEVDVNYQTNIKGIFAAGEVACTLGVIRPGGTALNSSQVSGMRIAGYVAVQKGEYVPAAPPDEKDAEALRGFIRSTHGQESTIRPFRRAMQSIMTEHFAFSRDVDEMAAQIQVYKENLRAFDDRCSWQRLTELPDLFKNRDMLLTQIAYAESMLYSAETAGSRGGALALKDGKELPEDTAYLGKKIITVMRDGQVSMSQRDVRPIPVERNLWLEKVWREYLEKRES